MAFNNETVEYTLRRFARVSVAMRARYGFVHTRRFNVPARGKERSSGEEDIQATVRQLGFPASQTRDTIEPYVPLYYTPRAR